MLLHRKIKRSVLHSGYRAVLMLGIFYCWPAGPLFAQQTKPLPEERIFEYYSNGDAHLQNDKGYRVILFNDPACLEKNKLEVIRSINNRLAIIRLEETRKQIHLPDCLLQIAPANDWWKLSADLENEMALLKNKTGRTVLFTIIATDIQQLLSTFAQKQVKIETIQLNTATNAALISCSPAVFFTACLPEADLVFADLYQKPAPDLFVIGYNRHINRINLAEHFFPTANGRGITIGIKEKMMDASDIDLQKRILPSILASPEKEYHANVIATLAGGAGNSFYTGKGLASRCLFFPSSYSNLFADSTALLLQQNVSVQNHAYGTQIQSFYGAEAVSYDQQLNKNKSLLHIFSSGNKGMDAAASGTYANLAGYANLTGNFKMAKNVISVAAVDTGNNLTPFSSAGPLFDGRLGPQLTALGPNGTSEAAAIVSGAVAIIQQVYKDSNAQTLPPASLVKAILFNSADDIGNKGIDYRSGFGLLNMVNAINCLQQQRYAGHALQTAQTWTKNLALPSQAANLKITLVWTDTAASVNTNKALVNDLDLELIELNTGTVYQPWQLSNYPNKDSLEKLPTRKRDALNTAEQVSIELPTEGQYLIKVTARQIQTTAPQDFHIAYSWDTLHIFRFTNPVHAADINLKENPTLSIEWQVHLADSQSNGNLFVTYDNGINWQPLANNISLQQQRFHWAPPVIATLAQLKMECNFGVFYSTTFVIATLTKINIDYRCADSVRLSWQKHIAANSYRIHVLGDTAFMRLLRTVTDTFIVIHSQHNPENFYAVEPVLTANLSGARSETVDIRQQGVDCFYKTLTAETAGTSIELQLAISFPAGVIKMDFEKLTPWGDLSRPLATVFPINGQQDYRIIDPAPVGGMNYYRVRIHVTGGIINTYTVQAFHNGSKGVLLFPNPVTKGHNLQYRIRESHGAVMMIITDMTGRVLFNKPVTIAGEIKTANLSPGLYLVMLTDPNGVRLETEKFIIQ